MSKVAVLRGQNTMPLQAMLDRPVAYHSALQSSEPALRAP